MIFQVDMSGTSLASFLIDSHEYGDINLRIEHYM